MQLTDKVLNNLLLNMLQMYKQLTRKMQELLALQNVSVSLEQIDQLLSNAQRDTGCCRRGR
jgi:hypothetical protein